MKKVFKLGTFVIAMALLVTSCSKKEEVVEDNSNTVTFYGWGGDEKINKWLDEYVAIEVKERYGIELKRVSMNIDEILVKLSNEKQANKQVSDIDIIWINGENFNLAKSYGILSEPFTDSLTNFSYIDSNEDFVDYDFNVPINGLEAPFGLSHLVFIGDSSKITMPKNAKELLEVAKENPGTITYPAPPDFTGSAFVRNIIYDFVGVGTLLETPNYKEAIKEVIQPALDYMNELEPYLWEQGTTYPKDEAILQKMYSDGQLSMTMSYTALLAPRNVKDGIFKEESEMFVFEKGNISNCHYLSIPFNAPNKDKAVQVIDFMLSPEAQSTKLDIDNWGDLSVLDMSKLSKEDKKLFEEVNKDYDVNYSEFQNKRLPEVDAKKISIIEELWEENVMKK